MLKPIPKWLAYTVGTIALVNFVAFVLISLYLPIFSLADSIRS